MGCTLLLSVLLLTPLHDILRLPRLIAGFWAENSLSCWLISVFLLAEH